MLTLIRAGLYTSVQDAGRFGMRQSGVSYCGALDRPALEIANVLVGNPGSTAALEITLGQCVIEFGQETGSRSPAPAVMPRWTAKRCGPAGVCGRKPGSV